VEHRLPRLGDVGRSYSRVLMHAENPYAPPKAADRDVNVAVDAHWYLTRTQKISFRNTTKKLGGSQFSREHFFSNTRVTRIDCVVSTFLIR